jgi:O-acetyl-ADP-ribose deacetylase (regulator of RNase III)
LAERNIAHTFQNKKEGDRLHKSYGIGTCILLQRPLNLSECILLVSVTEQRAGLGLYSNTAFVYKAVSEVYKKIIDNRIKNVYIPLIGSGHGGLSKRVAFLALVTAFSELIKRDSGNKIETFNIVIYTNKKDMDIPPKIVKRILRFGVGLAISKEGTISED